MPPVLSRLRCSVHCIINRKARSRLPAAMSISPANQPKCSRTEVMLSAHNSIYPDSPDDGCEFPNGPIDGQQSLEEAFQEAEEPNSVGVQGSMFADPEPHVETDIQEGLMRTVVPPSSVVLDVEVEALIAIASSEPRTVRAHILHAQKRWLAGPAANTKTLCRNGTGSVLPTRRHVGSSRRSLPAYRCR